MPSQLRSQQYAHTLRVINNLNTAYCWLRGGRIASKLIAGLGSSAAYARFAVCFHHAIRAEEQALRHARERMSRDVNGGEYAYLVEISHFLDDSEPPQSLPRAKWIGGTTVVRERWRALVDNRRAALEYEQRHGI